MSVLTTGYLFTKDQRIVATAKGLLLQWRDRPHLLYDVFLFGAPPKFRGPTTPPEQAFINMMRYAEAEYVAGHPDDVAPVNTGMTDAEYGAVFELITEYVKRAARAGAAWRKRRI